MNTIENLVDKYFEGETSTAEEKILRDYFTSGNVKDELKIYIPIFSYFEQEINKREINLVQPVGKRKFLARWVGIAASLLILVLAGIGKWVTTDEVCLCKGDYVVINGKCYTDEGMIRQYAFGALQEVATPVEVYFPDLEPEEVERLFFQQQLSELSDLFSDDF